MDVAFMRNCFSFPIGKEVHWRCFLRVHGRLERRRRGQQRREFSWRSEPTGSTRCSWRHVIGRRVRVPTMNWRRVGYSRPTPINVHQSSDWLEFQSRDHYQLQTSAAARNWLITVLRLGFGKETLEGYLGDRKYLTTAVVIRLSHCSPWMGCRNLPVPRRQIF